MMNKRCYDPKSSVYKHYGGRGITVCDEWRLDFYKFIEDMGERPEGYTLDRIDNNGNYEPGNCRWADVYTQRTNTRASTSHPGIRFRKGKYQPRIKVKGKEIYLGTFNSIEEAYNARNSAKNL